MTFVVHNMMVCHLNASLLNDQTLEAFLKIVGWKSISLIIRAEKGGLYLWVRKWSTKSKEIMSILQYHPSTLLKGIVEVQSLVLTHSNFFVPVSCALFSFCQSASARIYLRPSTLQLAKPHVTCPQRLLDQWNGYPRPFSSPHTILGGRFMLGEWLCEDTIVQSWLSIGSFDQMSPSWVVGIPEKISDLVRSYFIRKIHVSCTARGELHGITYYLSKLKQFHLNTTFCWYSIFAAITFIL